MEEGLILRSGGMLQTGGYNETPAHRLLNEEDCGVLPPPLRDLQGQGNLGASTGRNQNLLGCHYEINIGLLLTLYRLLCL